MDKRKKLQKAALREMQEEVRFRRHKYVAPVGIVFLLLAAVGLVTVCVFCVRFTQRLLDNSAEKARFEQVITPVLMLDPVPFGSAADADPLFLLQSSLWSALLGDKRESYQANEDSLGRIPVPASDVDVAAARLYGDVKLEHQSFTVNYVDNYVYDEDTKTYYVQVTGQVGLYTPNVEEIVKKGNQYTLLVGYVPPIDVWRQCAAGKTERPQSDKWMYYDLERVGDHYQILAIRDIPVELRNKLLERDGQPIPTQLAGDAVPAA